MPSSKRNRKGATKPGSTGAGKADDVSRAPDPLAAGEVTREARRRSCSAKAPTLPASSAAIFRKRLRAWYQANHRRLPWRTEPSLYRTVVSEMMLQQTRIDTALPFFERWMTALPDFASLAAASEEEVLKLWEGLGYYRRARSLQRLAREIVASPEIPRTPEAWQKYPGIGPYSSAAITSIAFEAPAACVDGNVVRVLARLTGHDSPLKDSTTAARLFQPLARQLLDPADPGLHNQAMMELGATVCQRKPDCALCPVAAFCRARRLGQAAKIPVFPPRQTEKREVVRVWAERRGRLLLARADRQAERLSRLYELPSSEQLGLSEQQVLSQGQLILKKKRSITRFVITESIYAIDEQSLSSPEKNFSWVPLPDLEKITLSGPHRRWIGTILAERNGGKQ